MSFILRLVFHFQLSLIPKILYRIRYCSWLKSVASFTHMPSGWDSVTGTSGTQNTKKPCFVRLRGCLYALHFETPMLLDTSLYVWTTPICLDVPACMSGSLHVWTLPHMFGHPLYVWMHQNVWTPPCMFGCPLVCFDATICLDIPLYSWIQFLYNIINFLEDTSFPQSY